ncbi:hypothetical protein JOS77_29345 [Chromobacterium haemolyticum]|nr:hypothetical protein JOS77_29345 [Chromobacterium haemolyticum]
MLRITELKLPLDHAPEELNVAIAAYLGVPEQDIRQVIVFKRSYDARKGMMNLAYIVDIDVANEARLLARFKSDKHVMPTPDTNTTMWDKRRKTWNAAR